MPILQRENSRCLGIKGILVFCFIILFCNIVSAQIIINEVMPNPDDNCSDCTEWIEIYSSSETNLSGFIIDTTGQNLSLNAIIYDYMIITGNKTKFLIFWPENETKVIQWSSIGLTNSGDSVRLYNQTNLTDNTTYISFSSDINKTWMRCGDNWSKSGSATPGTANNCSSNQDNQTNHTDNQSQWNISASFPQQVYNNGTEFNVSINFNNFENYVYDLKTEIKNSTSNIGEIFNPLSQEWQSTYNYIKEAFAISSSNLNYNAKLRINPDKNYIGQAFLQIKLQKTNSSTSYSSQIYSIEVQNGTSSSQSSNKGEMEYIIGFPKIINAGANFSIEIEAVNNQNHSQTIEIWSYVYSGSKCYSCHENESRESNKQEIKIDSDESEKVTLQNSINEDIENGTYKLKVKILKKGLKTAKEFTFDIDVINSGSQEEDKNSEETEKESILNQQSFGNTEKTSSAYESKAERNKKIAFYFLTISLLMVIIWLGKKE